MPKSAIASGMGLAMSIITNLIKAVKDAGGAEENLHVLSVPNGKDILEEIGAIVVTGGEPHTEASLEEYLVALEKKVKELRFMFTRQEGTIEIDVPTEKRSLLDIRLVGNWSGKALLPDEVNPVETIKATLRHALLATHSIRK